MKKWGNIIKIAAEDWKCMARAIIVSKAYVQKENGELSVPTFKYICRSSKPLQEKLADKLLGMQGFLKNDERKENGCSLQDAPKFQYVLALECYNLQIWGRIHLKDQLLWDGKITGGKNIYIYLRDGHFYSATSLTGFIGAPFQCSLCNKAYSKIEEHKCDLRCQGCRYAPPCPRNEEEHQIVFL